MLRTPKFLLAMNQAPIVVTSSWVEACVKADALVGKFGWMPAPGPGSRSTLDLADEAEHRLQDEENERKHGFKLAEALERAKQAKQRGGLMIGHRLILVGHAARLWYGGQHAHPFLPAPASTIVPWTEGIAQVAQGNRNHRRWDSRISHAQKVKGRARGQDVPDQLRGRSIVMGSVPGEGRPHRVRSNRLRWLAFAIVMLIPFL